MNVSEKELAEMEAMADDLSHLHRLTEYERAYLTFVPRLIAEIRRLREKG